MDNIMVSILMFVYNHEDYISMALDSILMQNVNFTYEILIADDASNDGTREILQKYKESYPDRIRLFFRKNNTGVSKNGYNLFHHSRGKYVALLDGDDYWVCENKLQKQIDFLENHSEYVATAHKCIFVDFDNTPRKDREVNQGFYNGKQYTVFDYEKAILPGQTGTLVMKNPCRLHGSDLRILYRINNKVFDLTLVLLILKYGPIYCFDEVMSHYRQVTNRGTSWSALQQQSNVRDEFFLMQTKLENYAAKYLNMEIDLSRRKHDIYISALFKMLRDKKKLDFLVLLNILRNSNQPLHYIIFGGRILLTKIIYKLIYNDDRNVKY